MPAVGYLRQCTNRLSRRFRFFLFLGKATETTLTRYERLPDSLRNISRKPLWELGRNSAGLAVRFRSNSTRIAAKWEVLLNRNMNHMTPTGIKGLDLYCLQDGKWLFAGSGRPQGKVNEATIVKDMLPEEREYLLFLSLYDGGDFSFHRHRFAVSNQRAGNGTAGT